MHFFYSVTPLMFSCGGSGGLQMDQGKPAPTCSTSLSPYLHWAALTRWSLSSTTTCRCFHPRARILDVFPSRRLPVNLSPWEPVLLQKTCLPWKAVLILQKFPVPLLRSFLKSSACVSQWFLTITLQDCLGNCVVLVPYEIRCCF